MNLWRKQTSSNCEIDNERPQKAPKDNDKTVLKSVKPKNNLKGGDPNEDNIHGRDHIEQATSSN